MRKKIIKFIISVMCFFLLFASVDSRRREAQADVATLTAAGIAAVAGVPLSTVLLGAAGIAAVGAGLYYADDIVTVGKNIAGKLISKGIAESDVVDEVTGKVNVTPDVVDGAAESVAAMPETISVQNKLSLQPMVSSPSSYLTVATITAENLPFAPGATTAEFTFTITAQANGPIYNYGQSLSIALVSGANVEMTRYLVATYAYPDRSKLTDTNTFTIKADQLPVRVRINGGMLLTNLTIANISNPTLVGANKTVESAPTSERAMQEYAYTNGAINQTVVVDPSADLTGAKLDDLIETSAANLDESVLQTGILSRIWSGITSLPSSIAAAATAAATSINNVASGLWEDAGAIWSGMTDKLTDIKNNLATGLNTLVDGMANGFDAVQTKLQEWQETWRAGIDSLLNNLLAGIGAFWTDAGIVWDGMLSSLDNLWTGIQDLTGTLVGGLSTTWDRITSMSDAITGSITGALDTISGWFVPPSWDFVETNLSSLQLVWTDKLGGLDDLAAAFKNLFAGANSIYDISVTFKERDYKIVPRFLEPVISGAKPFFTGAVNLFIVTRLYRRARGNEVVR